MARSTPLLFCVRRSKAELVKPETTTPRELKPLSDIDDQGGFRVQVPILMFYRSNNNHNFNNPVEVIKQGLAKALVFYYPLAGRVFEGQNKKLMVNCNEKGVWLVPARANIELEKLGVESMKPPCPYLKRFLVDVPGSKGVYDCPLVHVQVTRFTCGGFVLAIRFNHTIMDAQGFIEFLHSVSELGQGATKPSILPVWERQLLKARQPPFITCRHREFEETDENKKLRGNIFVDVEKLLNILSSWIFGKKLVYRTLMVKRSFTFGSKELEAIKEQCPLSTTFEALSACLWKCRTIALQPDPNATVHLSFVVNVRERLQLPPGFYGNAIISTAATTTAKMLCTNPISYAAELIREAKNVVHDDYVKSLMDLMVLRYRPDWPILRNLLIMDSTRFGFDEVDFGWGKPIFGGIVSASYGVGYLVPHKRMEDKKGVVVAIALPPFVMGKFRNEIRNMTRS